MKDKKIHFIVNPISGKGLGKKVKIGLKNFLQTMIKKSK